MLGIFNSSVKKLSNLESSFLITDTGWKNKSLVISTQTSRMVTNLSLFQIKNKCLSSQEKQDPWKGSCSTSKGLAKLLPRVINLYQITYIFCNTVSSISIQPFDTNSFAPRETFALQCVFRYTYCIKLLLSIFNSSEKKLPNLESHFLIIDTSWKNKALIISTQIFWMVINL